MVNSKIKDLLKINESIENEIIKNGKTENNNNEFHNCGNYDHRSIASNLSQILFDLLNKNHKPVEFPFELFVKNADKISLFPHPRYIEVGKHFHDFIEIIIVYSGCFTQKINEETITLNEGDICILHPNIIHSIAPTSKDDITINIIIRKNNFQFINSLFKDDHNLIIEFLLNCVYFRYNIIDYIIFPDCLKKDIKKYFSNILNIFDKKKQYYEEQINQSAGLLIFELIKKWIYEKDTIRYKIKKDMNKYSLILNSIRDNIIEIKDISRETELSVDDINRIIREFGNEDLDSIIRERNQFQKQYNESIENTRNNNKNIEIINELQQFYEKIGNKNFKEIEKLLGIILEKILLVSGENLFSLKTLCINICITMTREYVVDDKGFSNVEMNQFNTTSIIGNINYFNSAKDIIEYTRNQILKLYSAVNDLNLNPIVKEAKSIIEDKYLENISLNDIAKSLNVNESYLSRLIKKEIGKSFVDIINSLKIKKSKELLEHSSLNISQIAERCGFSDYAYFYQVFIKYENISPKQYRKHQRGPF